MAAWFNFGRYLPSGTSALETGLESALEPGIERGGQSNEATEVVGEGTNPRGDIPTLVGGSFDAAYDTAVEQPAYAEDNIDMLGPSVGETASTAADYLTTTGGDDGADDPWWFDVVPVVAVVAGLLLVLNTLAPYAELAAAGQEG